MDLFEDESGTLYAFKIQTEGEKKRMVVLEAPEHNLEFKVPKEIWDLFNAKYYHLYNLAQAPVQNNAGRDERLYKKYLRIKNKMAKSKSSSKKRAKTARRKN